MKKILSLSTGMLLFIVLLSSSEAKAKGKTLKVLFVGNSLTEFNNLPRMVARMAKSRGNKLLYASHTPGGARFLNHASDESLRQKIEKKPWDYVILQEQSQVPAFPYQQVSKEVFPYATELVDTIRKLHSRGRPVFFMTMAGKNGIPKYADVVPALSTYEGTQNRINQTYLSMGAHNKTKVAPVGVVWKKLRKEKPSLELYADEIHPNIVGTYVSACVIYATLFNQKVAGIPSLKTLDPADTKLIHRYVDSIVIIDRKNWDFRERKHSKKK